MNLEQLSNTARTYWVPSSPGRTLSQLFELYSNPESTHEELIHLIHSNPAYSHSILKQKNLAQKIKEWTEEDPNRIDQLSVLIERVVGILGKTAIRDLMVSMRIMRITQPLPKKPDEIFALKPSKQLLFALKTEELCQDQKFAFSDKAFIAGLHYDWLAAVLAWRKAPEEAKKALADGYTEGLRIAQYAYRISQQIKGIPFDHFVFASGLVLPLGKSLLAQLYPKGTLPNAWSATMAESTKFGALQQTASEYYEKKFFKITYPEMTAFYVQSLEFFSKVSPAIRYAREPWLLKSASSDQYQLAMILSCASTLALGKALANNEPLALREFQRKWLEKSGVKEDTLKQSLVDLAGGTNK